MYLTFLPHTLGYRDKAGDFTYQTSCQKAAELGICPAGAYQTGAPFYRGDRVLTSYFAPRAKLKGSEKTLLDTLAEKEAVDMDRAELTKLIGDPAKAGSSFRTFSRSAMSETPTRRSSTFSPTVTGAGATAMSPAALPGSASGRSLAVSTMGQTVPAPGRKRCRASS